jgi:hypothetical protein
MSWILITRTVCPGFSSPDTRRYVCKTSTPGSNRGGASNVSGSIPGQMSTIA